MTDIFLPESIQKKIDGLTYREENIGMSESRVWMFDDMVLKVERQSTLTEQQSTMLRWLEGKLPVPRIICSESSDGIQYLLMTRVHGKVACAEENMLQPEKTVLAIAEALQMLWTVDITDCPAVNSFDRMLADAEERIRCIPIETWHGHFTTPAQQLDWLIAHKPKEDYVFSHGDFCMPNVLLENKHVSGFVDLGQCGAADRWYDIALMQQSMSRNFSGFFGGRAYDGYIPGQLYEALKVKPDEEKIYYHLLMDELY